MADKAVEKQPAAEEITAEETDRQVSEPEAPIETGETTEPEVESPEKAVKTPTEEEGEIPAETEKMSAEQREAFIKQRLEIKKLREQLAEKERAKSALDALKPPTPGRVPSQMPKAQDFLDAEGRIDLVNYQNAVQSWNETQVYRNQSAQSQIKFEMEEKILKMEQPSLNPESEDFDPDLEKRVADRYGRMCLESLTKGLPEPSLSKVAKEVLKETSVSPKEKERISKETLEQVATKEQAASTSTGVVSGRAREAGSNADLDELRRRSKEGDDKAIADRLAAIGE